jgi:hypothetical protein
MFWVSSKCGYERDNFKVISGNITTKDEKSIPGFKVAEDGLTFQPDAVCFILKPMLI